LSAAGTPPGAGIRPSPACTGWPAVALRRCAHTGPAGSEPAPVWALAGNDLRPRVADWDGEVGHPGIIGPAWCRI